MDRTKRPAATRHALLETAGAAANEDLVAGNGRVPVPELSPSPRMRRGWLVRRILLGADLLGLTASFFLVEFIFRNNSHRVGIGVATAIFVAALPAWVVAAKLYGLYDRDEERTAHSTADDVVSVFHLITAGVWLFFLAAWLAGLSRPSQAKLATFWLLALVAVIAARSGARALARRHPSYIQNALIVGAGDVGQLIGRKLVQHPEYGIKLLGFVDEDPKERRRDLADLPILGAPDEIGEIVRRHEVDRVIVAFSGAGHEELLGLVRATRDD